MRRLHDNELLKMAESLRSQIGSKVEASGANGVVIGLSGGIDSALVCKLCSDVVDTKCFMLPETGISSEEDLNDAKGLCEGLGVPYEIIDIHPVTRVI
nr:NAD+ synthase [Candidatus Methanofastidiosa archaeon]